MARSEDRPAALGAAFVRLIDTLHPDYAVDRAAADLARACIELVPADAVGIALADGPVRLRGAAHSPDIPGLAELLAVDRAAGPGNRAHVSGEQVVMPDLGTVVSRHSFEAAGVRSGYRAAHALPMRLRTDSVGAVTLLYAAPDSATRTDIGLAEALARMAAIGIVTSRAAQANVTLAEQLTTALTSRIVIEQAKGLVAAHNSGDLEAAFAVIRATARSNNVRVHQVATAIVEGRVSAREMARRETDSP